MSNVVYVGTRGSRHREGNLAPVVQGSTESLHTITVQYADETVYDLTGKTITGTMKRNGDVFAITGTLAVTSAATGVFSWDKSAADVGTPGTFDVQFVITEGAEFDATFDAPMTIEPRADATAVAAPGYVGIIETIRTWLTALYDSIGGVTGTSEDNVVTFDANGIPQDSGVDIAILGGGAAGIDSLTDVTITTPADNSVLAYDSGSALWINQTAAEAGLGAGDMLAATYDPAGVAEQFVGLTTAQVLTNKDLTDFSNNVDADDVHVLVRNDSGATLAKGTPVYISGYNVGLEIVLVDAADASSDATMPAIGILAEEILNNAQGGCIVTGRIEDVDTSGFLDGAELYVSETAGALTATKPTGSAAIQKVATVLRIHATNGVLAVGTSSTEDLPNIAQDNVWVGNASGVPTATAIADVQDKNEYIILAVSDETSDLAAGAAKVTFRMPYAMTLSDVRASVTTAPTGSAIQVDINEGGVSILSTEITIDAGDTSSEDATTPPVISDTALAADAEITIDVDAVGSGDSGAGLKVYLIGER